MLNERINLKKPFQHANASNIEKLTKFSNISHENSERPFTNKNKTETRMRVSNKQKPKKQEYAFQNALNDLMKNAENNLSFFKNKKESSFNAFEKLG